MDKSYSIAYYIRTDIQHIPYVIGIYEHLGGIILTKTKAIHDYILQHYSHLNPEVIWVKNTREARKVARARNIKLVIYTGFQMIHWGYSIQIFHGPSDKIYLDNKKILLYDKLLLAGQKDWDEIQHAKLLKKPERFEIIGYPKFDRLVNDALPESRVFSNNRPTILYAPTWISQDSDLKIKFSDYGESSLPLWGKKLVEAIAPHWNLIIKYHSRINKNQAGIYEAIDKTIHEFHAEDRVKVFWDADICPFMKQADLMISDISAVCYEWFHLNRPIVFANPAPEHYRPSSDRYSRTYAWRAGDVLYQEEEIVPVIRRNLEADHYRDVRNELLTYCFHQPDGKATQRQIDSIVNFYQRISGARRFRPFFMNLRKMVLHR